MTGRQQQKRIAAHALRRAFAIITLLAGLVGMHALTAGHNPVLRATVAIGPADAAAGGYSHLAGPEHPHQAATDRTAVGKAASAAETASGHPAARLMLANPPTEPAAAAPAIGLSDGCVGCGQGQSNSHDGSHLLNTCLAVLLAGAVTFALVAARRARPDLGREVVAGARAVASQLTGLRPPSLFRLGVLRT